MADVSMQIDGLEQVLAKLRKLDARVQNNIGKRGVRAGAKVVLKAARSRAPSPVIAKALQVNVRSKRNQPIYGNIRARKNAFLAKPEGGTPVAIAAVMNFIEFGTVPRTRKTVGGKFAGAKNTSTGRITPRPWMRPALQASASAAVKAFKAKVDEGIKQEMAKK